MAESQSEERMRVPERVSFDKLDRILLAYLKAGADKKVVSMHAFPRLNTEAKFFWRFFPKIRANFLRVHNLLFFSLKTVILG